MTTPDGIVSALAVALARQSESHADCPLFNDPYAQVFIDAALSRGCQLPSDETSERINGIANYASSRTKWFDEYFIAAGAHGLEQMVIVAAGLDARAWRLPWVAGTTLFEIDHPGVLKFKNEALHEHGESPSVSRYVPVPADLSDGWSERLRDAGFDVSEPTAWAVEGLLPYVADGPHLLFDRIHEISPAGSRLAVEAVGTGVADWLSTQGWQVTVIGAQELMTRYGRCGDHSDTDAGMDTVFVNATRDR
ncbi:SAM-dependent methyltransferase [Mycolicibacterium monacense]|uniref:Putative S-adenosyl-L-methionine-dependent methyltransferase Mjls_0570 n=2 Tax=Mycobacteriaceae TaxID=1762 RepID=Y570_MYCSJ|nr:SAM-dependent methyltransferase [Mycolicibacterium monacense]A3PU05.1 RecName: Full=Putative S-adenosyl-L-methionine-dependent methyltransferase Mjls_0570 [Mycobacterium sp. JLS]MDA4100129.1 SAM-dependent methyltransferase [Mycolicibacterium monacense DSM 44395]ORB14180.1 SAM-dependent methyltransferase [Mycolicibacterium monacense DSM 44395]QHP84424.1 SAM-dependent methyltransferase [Mycolicibacterium monacense DSM 44395]BBZ62815.1 putative S-adenosyl-L-methionine-dependent methyltransfera